MLASQLAHTIVNECGGLVGSRAAGEFLTQRMFKAGAFMRWDGVIEEATGAPLSADAFASDVTT
jgi:hypothetical protein